MENIQKLLNNVQKPGRYIGKELNSVYKEIKSDTVRYLISYPDIYEIGMSNTGIRILYHILNRIEGVYCERTFAPWIDMANEMKKNKIPLFSLETHTPAREFDIWSFTLEYDLCLTNVLLMLDLANVPRYTNERTEQDPVIIAGGTLTFNPLPYERFFDVIAIGEGEDLLPYMMKIAKDWKKNLITREEFLKELSQHESLYVPKYNTYNDKKKKAIVEELRDEDISVKDIIPNIEIVHHRMTIEIMRGCTRSCRFCQAGNVYKPLRLRDSETVLRLAKQMYFNMGMEELSLLSLSASDYPYLYELLDKLILFFDDKYVNISLPSLRGDALTESLAKRLSRIRKSSLTFAPEAGTDRLRNIINKDIKEEDIFRSIEIALKYGWKHIKLYYMIGLPGETDRDIDGLIDMVKRIKKTAKNMNIKVSVSPFVPRPVTPFERVKQASISYIKEKNKYIYEELRRIKGVNVSLREPEIAFLEGIFSRGKNLENLIERAYDYGAVMDEWSETFNFNIWDRALNDTGVDTDSILKGFDENQVLPWDFIDSPVSKRFLSFERKKAERELITRDCRYANCYGCDACNLEIVGQLVDIPIPDFEISEQKMIKERAYTLRLRFTKIGDARFLAYFDIVRFFTYALKRAEIPVVFSRGFNPRMKLSFGPPLSLGFESIGEYVDIELYEKSSVKNMVNKFLPGGVNILDEVITPERIKSISAIDTISLYEFRNVSENLIDNFIEKKPTIEKVNKKGNRSNVALFDYIREIKKDKNNVLLYLKSIGGKTVGISEFVKFLKPRHIIKLNMFVEKEGELISLMDILKGDKKDG